MSTVPHHIRIPEEDLKTFKEVCSEKFHVDHNDMIRELIVATNEGRIKITPSKGQTNQIKELYS